MILSLDEVTLLVGKLKGLIFFLLIVIIAIINIIEFHRACSLLRHHLRLFNSILLLSNIS